MKTRGWTPVLVLFLPLIALGEPATRGEDAAVANGPPGRDHTERPVAAENGMAGQLFEGAVFGSRGALRARQQVELALEKKIGALDAISGLTDTQRQKLRLAGHGDIKRLFGQIKEAKARLGDISDNDVENERFSIMQQGVPFSNRLRSGPFDEGSLYAKTMLKILTPEQVRREETYHRALAVIAQRGGDVKRQATDAGAVHIVSFSATAIDDDDLELITGIPSLYALELSGTGITDVGLARLQDLKSLELLDLSGTPVSDEGVAKLRRLTGLEVLDLGGTRIGDAALGHIAGMTKLKRLDLRRTQVTDAGLEHLGGLTNLNSLFLIGTPITDAGLTHLARLKGLESLQVSQTRITDAGLVDLKLKEWSRLQRLALHDTAVTDASLTLFKDLRDLQTLDLRGTQITDAGLVHLRGLRNLTLLEVTRTRVTAAGIADLKRSLPGVTVQK
jgi:Leucine-rich repeat (LRR) protein